MDSIEMLPKVSLEDTRIRLGELQKLVSEGNLEISKAESQITAARFRLATITHEISYWKNLGKILLRDQLSQCKALVLDSLESEIPRDRALTEIHGLSRAIFFLQMNAISNQYGLVEEAKEIVSELKARVPTWFSPSGSSSDAVQDPTKSCP